MTTLTILGSGVLEISDGVNEPEYITAKNGDFEIRNDVFFLQDSIFEKEYRIGDYSNVVGFASKAELISYLGDFFSASGTVALEAGAEVAIAPGSEIAISSFQDNYKDFKSIFDGQTHFFEPTDKFNKYTVGTGAVTYDTNTNRYTLSVAADLDVAILQQSFNNPYFAGNKQMFDITSELMSPQIGVRKIYGYFDWDAATPDFTKIDGLYLETDDTKIYFRICNSGTILHEVDLTTLSDWDKFNVVTCFFLWLGGAIIEPYMFLGNATVEALQNYSHVGQAGQFIKMPSKPITMAVVSNGGAGSAKYVCSMVATKQMQTWSGVQQPVYMPQHVSAGIVGTYYHLKGVRINPNYKRGASAQIERVGVTTDGSRDCGILFLTRNANISLTYADLITSVMQESTDEIGSSIALADIGEIISAFEYNSANPTEHTPEYFGKFLPNAIEGNPDTYHFIYLAQTSNQNIALVTRFTEFR